MAHPLATSAAEHPVYKRGYEAGYNACFAGEPYVATELHQGRWGDGWRAGYRACDAQWASTVEEAVGLGEE